MAAENKHKTIFRDVSWLSFNGRVLQEAADPTVPLPERIRFLGIFSNNLDEFFRVRVATLRRMVSFGEKNKMHMEKNPQEILDDIQMTVLNQQSEFNRIWEGITAELKNEKIFLVKENELNKEQQDFVKRYYEDEVSANIIPLMIEGIPNFPELRDRSIYLAVVMWKKESALKRKYALIEIPFVLNRFVQIPSPRPDEHHIILLEDVIRFNLPAIFSFFGYDQYSAYIFKVTRDAEIDIDNDIHTSIIQKLEKALKNRKKGKPVRFVYDREMDPGMLEYLIRRLNLSKRDNLIPGGRIHNFRDFMDFPENVFKVKSHRRKPFVHPALVNNKRVTDVIMEKEVMLHFPYHSFSPMIDLLREAAIDPDVTTIKITGYRLATQSKIMNALVNAVRNGKQVVVVLELRARFDEEANLEWKARLEEEGARVIIGLPDMKVHSKICLIKKRMNEKTVQYGFVSTGNLNEKTAKVYADHCLLTSNKEVMADVNRIFNFLENPRLGTQYLKDCSIVLPSPVVLRKKIFSLIENEIKNAKSGKPASMILKMNSLSDESLIMKLNEAAKSGVELHLIVRGIFCMHSQSKKYVIPVNAISIVDEYLEHARVWVFHNNGKEKVYISSADWMVRNLDHRVEATCQVNDEVIKQELKDILNIQLSDNVKARKLNNELSNEYISTGRKKIRSQVETYKYLYKKTQTPVNIETGSN
jgi:polyphosphate kinase